MSSIGYYGVVRTQEEDLRTYNYIISRLVPIIDEKYGNDKLAESVKRTADFKLRGLTREEKQTLRSILQKELDQLLGEISRLYMVRGTVRGNPMSENYLQHKINVLESEESSAYGILSLLE